MKFIAAQSFKALNMYVVHFGLIQNEPKDQGGESLVGGLFIDAAPFEWSIKLIAVNNDFGR
jgi:hypothetical protein